MNDFVTWEGLGTLAGASAMVLLIVQYLKMPLDKIWRIPTRALVYMLSFLILVGGQAVQNGLSWGTLAICALNAVLVSFTAMGAYEATFGRNCKEG